jgi:hypothetical protein
LRGDDARSLSKVADVLRERNLVASPSGSNGGSRRTVGGVGGPGVLDVKVVTRSQARERLRNRGLLSPPAANANAAAASANRSPAWMLLDGDGEGDANANDGGKELVCCWHDDEEESDLEAGKPHARRVADRMGVYYLLEVARALRRLEEDADEEDRRRRRHAALVGGGADGVDVRHPLGAGTNRPPAEPEAAAARIGGWGDDVGDALLMRRAQRRE